MPPVTSSLLSRSTTCSSSSSTTRISAAATAAISKPAADAAPSPSPRPARPSPRPKPASPFASGLSGRLFGGHRAAARSSSSAAAVFERRFASAATRNSYDEILTSLAKPGGGAEFGKYYSLPALSDPRIDRLPYSIRILLESAIRNCDEFQVTGKDVEKIIDWENSAPKQVEIPFKPARVLLQDFTGVPAVVDLACMRDAMSKLGSDPNKINPLVPVDLVIDHSVQVDVARSQNAVQANMELEFHRNMERFGFLKWGSTAFRNMLVVPPGSGIVHQVNLEYLARVVFNNGGILYPDSVVGTDSHTTMIDGLGVAGWGVGGIEAEAAMLGQPMSMVLPGVVGFKLTGKLRNGVTATDLVLTVTQMLRKHGVVGKFVEFYGGGMSELSLADRATIANMSPEYGATMGFFPVDGKTLDYLKLTGRSDDTVAMVESYLRANKMFVDYNQVEAERVYSSYLELNLEEVEPCLSGPKRPHDRVTLKNMKSDWLSCLDNNVGFKGFAVPKESQGKVAEFSFHGTPAKIKHGDVVIAAITSCTNTSNPNVMLGAALVAKKACELGLELVILGGIAMTVFLRTKMSHEDYEGGVIYLGVLFLGLVTHLFNGFAELAMSIVKLPIYYKQRDYCFYPSWIYALPTWILKIPISFVGCAVWIAMTYYGIGFDPNIERFFRHYLVLVLVSQLASGLFRLLASLGREMVLADTFRSFAQLIMLALSGFIISRENIRKWWVWGYWASPLMYAQNLIAQNEFLGHKWNKVRESEIQELDHCITLFSNKPSHHSSERVPSMLIFYMQTTDHSFSNDTLGVQILKARGIFVDPNWYWIGVGGLIAYILLFNILFIVFLHFLGPLGKGQAVVSEEALRLKHANRTGEDIELLPTGTDTEKPASQVGTAALGSTEAPAANRKKGMVLPFTSLSITFDNIRYSVDMPQEMKNHGVIEDRLVLLKGVSGAFRPGVLTALMGISGAGKTTLMDVLAGRKTGGYIDGDICISGYPKKQETFARISGYCEQNDIHSPHVTVYESLRYSAWLRLPAEVDANARKMFIEEVMELVELDSIRGALVGLPGVNGLSTEQRKRLTIAVELVANPSIIFMDEPTSGLDARAAAIVMRTVRNIVDTGRTLVCTIHQPSIDIFEAFDELFLMKRGGEEIYVGPLGQESCLLIKYFESLPGVKKIKDGYNPATWMLEVTAQGQEDILGVNFADIYKKSDLFKRNKKLIQELSAPPPGSSDLFFPTKYSQSFFTQCKACLWKQHKSYWRNPSYTAMRIFFTTVIALIFGTIFWKLGKKVDTQQDLFNSLGSMYAAVLFIGIQNGMTVQPIVDVERTVFYREKAAGLYSALPYAFAQVFIEVPHIFLQAIVYGVVVYSCIGFDWTVEKFFWYLFFTYFTFMYFTFYGMMAVAMTPNSDIGAIVSTAFYAIWNMFAGYLIPRPRIPVWWRWYYYICPVAYSLYGLVGSQFGEYTNTLEDNGMVVKDFLNGYFGIQRKHVGSAGVAVVGFTLLFAFIFAVSIKVFNFQKR